MESKLIFRGFPRVCLHRLYLYFKENIMRKIKRIIKFLNKVLRSNLKNVFIIIENHLDRQSPTVKLYSTKYGELYLIENDVMTEVINSGRSYEPHFYDLIKIILNGNDNVIDLGANIGLHSISMARLVPQGMVYSFEPQSLSSTQLQLNALRNNIDNIRVYNLAASNLTGFVCGMEFIDYSKSRSNIGNIKIVDKNIGDLVMTLSLDDLSLRDIAFVKIDVQGYEYLALQGMRNILMSHRPLIFLEIEEHHLVHCGTSSEQLINFLLNMNYYLYRINTDYPCDHLAIPREKSTVYDVMLLNKYKYDITKIDGKSVKLTFGQSKTVYQKAELGEV